MALAPKCVLCVLGYAGLGAAFGVGGPEICGMATGGGPGAWATALAWLGAAAGLGTGGWFASGRLARFLKAGRIRADAAGGQAKGG